MRGHPDCGARCANPTRDLEVIVCLSDCLAPGVTTVDADLHRASTALAMDNLCGEPVLRDTEIRVDLEIAYTGRTGDVSPVESQDADSSVGQFGKSMLEKIQSVVWTSWTLVDNLVLISRRHPSWAFFPLTIAVMVFPLLPLMRTQPPQFAEEFQLTVESAVPYKPEGREAKEHAPSGTSPV
ncbi:hypothetical protein ANO11243_016520 [Dothideomycetidae sp. 11243]|nr:hypothetical protein ANO11243_016520 [fungal sp. No.11243]